MLLSITATLRQAGHEVLEADNGDDAILLARQYRPDLAVIDIRMDGKSGFDVAAYFRDYVNQPFLFLTACENPEDEARGLEYGALAYLVKPIETPRLLAEIERVLEQLARVLPDPEAVRTLTATGDDHQQWVAVGILMVRERLDLRSAVSRLADLAQSGGKSLKAAAVDVMQALDRDRPARQTRRPKSGR
ncbi:MAG: response regulator [Burkholderiaceae bacterium]